jgi:hypothetical protein
MIIMTARNENDERTLILGLEEKNIEQLKLGKPIFHDLRKEGGTGSVDMFAIIWGPDKNDILRQLREAGMEGLGDFAT